VRRIFDGSEETGFLEAELKGAEFGGEERDDCQCWGWREEDGVYAVDYAVGAEDVDGDDLAVEVDVEAFEQTERNAETLWFTAETVFAQGCGDSV